MKFRTNYFLNYRQKRCLWNKTIHLYLSVYFFYVHLYPYLCTVDPFTFLSPLLRVSDDRITVAKEHLIVQTEFYCAPIWTRLQHLYIVHIHIIIYFLLLFFFFFSTFWRRVITQSSGSALNAAKYDNWQSVNIGFLSVCSFRCPAKIAKVPPNFIQKQHFLPIFSSFSFFSCLSFSH